MAERSSERMKSRGHIEVICGSMYSGKSEELIRRVKRADIAHQKIQVFKPAKDNRRGNSTINSYDGRSWEAYSVESSVEIYFGTEADTQVIAVDEAQFLDDSLFLVCRQLALEGKRVIVAGLDKDFRGEPFGPMPNLLTEAEYVDKLHAICDVCGDDGTIPQRNVNGEPAAYGDPVIMLGAKESYGARCRHCHQVKDAPTPDFVLEKRDC